MSASLLRGAAVRQDGRSASLTAPNGQAQRNLLLAAHAEAGVRPTELARFEAHGTGTMLGDPIEAGSLAAAVLASVQDSGGANPNRNRNRNPNPDPDPNPDPNLRAGERRRRP